jgi:ketosteroid isomerase-like protein
MNTPVTLHPTTRAAFVIVAIGACFAPSAAAQHEHHGNPEAAIGGVLDALHQAASDADFDKYFALYADEAVFLGTDSTERWTIDEFKAYTKPRFEGGGGWTYKSTQRDIAISQDGNTAWFDELLWNANLGTCRGSGVLVKVGNDWKVSQYNLSIPIPNDLARGVVDMIRETGGGE